MPHLATFVFLKAALVAALWFASGARAENVPGRFRLQDQFGTWHDVGFPRDRVIVLALADRQGSDQLEGWIDPLVERYPDRIDLQGVARLAGVPSLMRPALRALFRRALDQPVMMDWTGIVSDDFRYQQGVVNLLVITPAGRIDYRFNGVASPEELIRCFESIDRILEASVPREG
ncbi:MAG: hypothetical protein U1E27_05890 [Kiritimatiellia bacterium]|nr:hypothetical protein [Kiritimatiellia bacterium]